MPRQRQSVIRSLPRHWLPCSCVNVYIGLPGTRTRQPCRAASGPALMRERSSAHAITKARRGASAFAVVLGASLALAGCGGSSGGGDGASAGGTSPGKGKPECATADAVRRPDGQEGLGLHLDRRPGGPAPEGLLQAVRELHGREDQVRGLQGVRGAAVGPRQGAATRRTSRIVPQPGLLKHPGRADRQGRRRPRKATSDNVDKYCGEDWKDYGTVDGKFYAAPLGANVKSFVWYSPKMFKDKGWTVPTTLGRADRAVRHDRGDRHQAVVRRHRVR